MNLVGIYRQYGKRSGMSVNLRVLDWPKDRVLELQQFLILQGVEAELKRYKQTANYFLNFDRKNAQLLMKLVRPYLEQDQSMMRNLLPTPQASPLGGSFRYRDLTEPQKVFIYRSYTERGPNLLAEELKIPVWVVKEYAKRNNLKGPDRHETRKLRNFSANVSTFEKGWSVQTAYLMGCIQSDGIVDTRGNFVRLGVSTLDEDWLLKIRLLLESTHKVTRYSGFTDKRGYFVSPVTRCTISSRKLVADIFRLMGIGANKSAVGVPYPKDLPEEFLSVFVRGLLEGDGSVLVEPMGLELMGSHSMMTTLNEKLGKLLAIQQFEVRRRSGFSVIAWHAKSDLEALYSFLYKDLAVPYAIRKRRLLDFALGKPLVDSPFRMARFQACLKALYVGEEIEILHEGNKQSLIAKRSGLVERVENNLLEKKSFVHDYHSEYKVPYRLS